MAGLDSTGRHHAVLDPRSRERKARKIRLLLEGRVDLLAARILDIGAGSGAIASHLGAPPRRPGSTVAVDVVDVRQATDGYSFVRATALELPFKSSSFDVVVSNHVLEHVGPEDAQVSHLREFARLLVHDGCGYLAVPNRWRLMERHFDLPLLSWLPERLRSPYVRLLRRGSAYDCYPPSRADLHRLFAMAGIDGEDVTLEAAEAYRRTDQPGLLEKLILRMPRTLLRSLRGLAPTHVFIIRRSCALRAATST
jgi:SAM-dependent methyltransferase